jgi:radical SAM protein with 4Fe4S-binding SPASM domain
MIPFCLAKIRRLPDESFVAFSPVCDSEIGLDYRGIRILELCDGERTIEEIESRIPALWPPVSIDSVDSVRRFLGEMNSRGIVSFRKRAIEESLPLPPRTVFWDITARCNLRCLHCYNPEGLTTHDEVSDEAARKTLVEMQSFGVSNLVFTGGEPFARPGFPKLLAYAAELEFPYVSAATNGTLFRREFFGQLRHPNLFIQISIDGSTPAIHDRMRGVEGSFECALAALKQLQTEGVQVKTNTTVTRLNFHDVPNIIDLLTAIGVPFRFQSMAAIGRGGLNADQIMLSPSEFKFLMEYLVSRNIDAGGLSFTLDDPPELTCDPEAPGACGAGSSVCAITPSGIVVPCTYLPGLNGVDIRFHPFGEIWRHSRCLNFFRSIRLGELHGHCTACAWFARCRGGCRAECYTDGDLFGSNRNCWIAEELLEPKGASMTCKQSDALNPRQVTYE